MYRTFTILAHKDYVCNCGFLNKTFVLKKDDYFLLVYFEPLDMSLDYMWFKDIKISPSNQFDVAHYKKNGWKVARDFNIALPNDDTRAFIDGLDIKFTKSQRLGGHYLPLDRSMINLFTCGISTRREATRFVKCFYKAGYGYMDILSLLSVVSNDKSENMVKHCMYFANKLYENVEA